MWNRAVFGIIALGLGVVLATSATSTPTPAPTEATQPTPSADAAMTPAGFGPAPEVPSGPLDPSVAAAVEYAFDSTRLAGGVDQTWYESIATIQESGDPRVAWWLTDLLRIARGPDLRAELTRGFSDLLGVAIDPLNPWGDSVDHLIAWDIPAPPEYLTYKRNLYLLIEPRWDRLFVADADVDWRYVSWGGVLIDDRPYDRTDELCSCIPAADNPAVTDVAGGDEWLADDAVVFGVAIGDEARAYPRSTMEVREMVNDTLGGRDIAMPYCTLCGSAQVYLTDEVPAGLARPVLRTSGLLSRSNKVMYDVQTWSLFDTFTGRALSGPLAEAGVVLDQHSVLATTWGEWKTAYPHTTVLAIEEALGRPDSDLRNTRDADGPIFPIGDVDPRLGVQTDVIGVIGAGGRPVAFDVNAARTALAEGTRIVTDGVELVGDGGGLRAVIEGTDEALPSHQAFWFAWSQFHPDTVLWP